MGEIVYTGAVVVLDEIQVTSVFFCADFGDVDSGRRVAPEPSHNVRSLRAKHHVMLRAETGQDATHFRVQNFSCIRKEKENLTHAVQNTETPLLKLGRGG